MSITLPEIIQAARLALIYKRPYLASIVWALIPIARNTESGLQTMAVDRWGRWYINIEEVSKWPIERIALGIIHECNHLLRRHHDRMLTFQEWMTGYGVSLSNIGGDLEINDGLADECKDFNTELPQGWLYPKDFKFPDGLLAEEYCEMLLKDAQKDNRCFHMPQPCSSSGGKNKNKGGGDGDKQSIGAGKCGSCSGSGQQPWEDGPPKGQADGNSNTPGLSPAEMDVVRRCVANSVKDYSNSRGTVPGGWTRWADTELEPSKIPWTRELAAIIRRTQADLSGMVDYTWRKLSRRSTDEIILPGLRKPKLEAVGVIDTSGSMGEDDLAKALREFAGVLKVVGLSGMRFIAVDAAAHVSKKVFKVEQIELCGGGGTDMRVGIEAALKMKPSPDYVIVFTDAYTPWPEHPPADGTKVVAVITRPDSPAPPAWIRALRTD